MYLGEHRHAQLLVEEVRAKRSSNLVLKNYNFDDWIYDFDREPWSW